MKAYESPYSAQETVATISRSCSVARNESGSAARKRSASSSPGFQPSAAAHEIATWAARSESISRPAAHPDALLPPHDLEAHKRIVDVDDRHGLHLAALRVVALVQAGERLA